MASITSTITLIDRMTPVLDNIINGMQTTINMLDRTDAAIDKAFDPAQIFQARAAYGTARAQLSEIEEQLQKNTQRQEEFNDEIIQGTRNTDSLLGKIKGFAGAYLGVQGLNKLTQLSDTMAQTTARLSLLTNYSAEETEALNDRIYASAMRSRMAYQDVAASVSKLGLLAGKAFTSNDEIVAFTELMNKNFKIGGASLQEQSSAMYQLTQAMASGRLQGDEYRSIIENAPLLANSIEDYMRNVQKAKGTMKDWASEGLLTADVIKAAMFSSADEVEERFKNMPVTWAEVWTMAANKLQRVFKPVLSFVNLLARNWSILEPIVIGLATAVGLYASALTVYAITQKIANLQAYAQARALLANINMQAIAVNQQYALAVATAQATIAQTGFNTALLACPITWIILAIIVLVALLYTVIAVINKVKGTTISATGVIVGGLNVVLQFIWNLAKFIANILLGIFNWVDAVCSNIKIAFHNSIEGVKGFFWDLLATATEVIGNIAQKLNELPFVNIDIAGLTGAADEFRAKAEAARNSKLDYVDTKQAFMDGFNTLDAFQDGWAQDAYNSGYSVGEGIADKVGGYFDNAFNYGDMASDIGAISDDTGSIADSVSATEEEIKYLREIAERDVINRFTTAEIKVDMSGMSNNITNGLDIDGVIDHMAAGASEALEIAAEGVHR